MPTVLWKVREKAPHLPGIERASGRGCLSWLVKGEQENWKYITSSPKCQYDHGVCDLKADLNAPV